MRCAALEGAYALVALTNKKLIGARDPLGIRPLILGELNGAYILCSETCALDIIGARFVREIENGEVVVISEEGVESHSPLPQAAGPRPASSNTSISRGPIQFSAAARSMKCASSWAGSSPSNRRPMPMSSFRFPTSGVPAALGYAQQTGIPFELGIIRNHYVGRTFIEPTQTIRSLGVKLKHNANRAVVAGQARRAGRRFHRARHHLGEDRAHDV